MAFTAASTCGDEGKHLSTRNLLSRVAFGMTSHNLKLGASAELDNTVYTDSETSSIRTHVDFAYHVPG